MPQEAILQRADGQVVYAWRDDRNGFVERVSVETGTHLDGRVEIRSGLAAGDEVVTRGHRHLVDGTPISRRNAGRQPVDRQSSLNVARDGAGGATALR